jgi:excisionase family DNA binding protein
MCLRMAVTDAPRLLAIDEVANRLRLSRRTVERLIGAELLPAYRVGRRAIRVDENQLEAWIYGDVAATRHHQPRIEGGVPARAVDAPSAGHQR